MLSDTNLILEKKDWGLSISVGQDKWTGGKLQPVKGWDVDISTCSRARYVLGYLGYPMHVCTTAILIYI